MPRDLSNAGQSPFDVARTPSSVARDMVLGSLTKSKKMALAGDPLTPHQKMFQIKEIYQWKSMKWQSKSMKQH